MACAALCTLASPPAFTWTVPGYLLLARPCHPAANPTPTSTRLGPPLAYCQAAQTMFRLSPPSLTAAGVPAVEENQTQDMVTATPQHKTSTVTALHTHRFHVLRLRNWAGTHNARRISAHQSACKDSVYTHRVLIVLSSASSSLWFCPASAPLSGRPQRPHTHTLVLLYLHQTRLDALTRTISVLDMIDDISVAVTRSTGTHPRSCYCGPGPTTSPGPRYYPTRLPTPTPLWQHDLDLHHYPVPTTAPSLGTRHHSYFCAHRWHC